MIPLDGVGDRHRLFLHCILHYMPEPKKRGCFCCMQTEHPRGFRLIPPPGMVFSTFKVSLLAQ